MYNWQWWGLRRYILIYWRSKGVLVRKGYWNRKPHAVKLLNRNCMHGKKYKSLLYLIKSLHLIHLFTYWYGKKTKNIEAWKIRRYLFFSLDNFFFWNRPFYTKKIRIRKKKKNEFVLYQVWEEKMPFELFKWFWLLSFKQPFKKVYQRFAFIMLDLIFFTDNNMFKVLIQKLRQPSKDEFDRTFWAKSTHTKTMPPQFVGKIIEL